MERTSASGNINVPERAKAISNLVHALSSPGVR